MKQKWNEWNREKERFIEPVHDDLIYCGRIDDSEPDAPVFIMPGSFVEMTFSGSSYVKAVVVNHRFSRKSWVGVLLDDKQSKVAMDKDEEPVVLLLAENLEKGMEHKLTFFKRMDPCHEFIFLGFLLEYGARIGKPQPLPRRKIEFYGDSVTAGEVVEAVDCCGMPDPLHNGEYSNAYFSYAWITARMLHARVHLVAQGEITFLDGIGSISGVRNGMENCYDKLRFLERNGKREQWDFGRFTPHVVVVAVGQNDAFPNDFMKEDYYGAQAEKWREHYLLWIRKLRRIYPDAWIVLTTSIVFHSPGWDRSIGKVCTQLADPKIVHFIYDKNGRGTPGNVRVPEAMEMALELSRFINAIGDNIWD